MLISPRPDIFQFNFKWAKVMSEKWNLGTIIFRMLCCHTHCFQNFTYYYANLYSNHTTDITLVCPLIHIHAVPFLSKKFSFFLLYNPQYIIIKLEFWRECLFEKKHCNSQSGKHMGAVDMITSQGTLTYTLLFIFILYSSWSFHIKTICTFLCIFCIVIYHTRS